MLRFRTIITAAAVPAATAGVLLASGGAAGAATTAPAVLMASHARPAVAIGSVELGQPLQYERFVAVQGVGRYHGAVDYTNWTYAEPGSGVWAPAAQPQQLVFTYQGSQYAHSLNNGSLKLVATSPDRLLFTGSGSYNGQAGDTWAIKGQVKDAQVKFTITYNGTLDAGYSLTATGTVAKDGSASGTAESSDNQSLTWAMPAGAFASVLHYVTPISSASVHPKAHNATFQFTIPASVPGLAGTKVTVQVHDGGRGIAHDTYAHGVTGSPASVYPIIGGPGVTIR